MGNFAIRNQNAPSSPGTLDFRVDGFGSPIGFIVMAGASGADRPGIRGCIGFGDLTAQFCMAFQMEDGNASPAQRRQGRSDACVSLLDDAGAQEFTASFNGLVKDGIQLNFTAASSPNIPVITVLLIGGPDFRVKAITGLTPNVIGTLVRSDVDFEADDILWMSTQDLAAEFKTPAETAADTILSLGLCHNDNAGVVTMRSNNIFGKFPGAGSSDNAQAVSDLFVMLGMVTTGATTNRVALEAFTNKGFTIRETNAAGAEMPFAAFCMRWGSRTKSLVSNFDSPPTTANQVITTPQFKPQALLMLPSIQQAFSTSVTDTFVFAFAMGLMTKPGSDEFSNSWSCEDAVTPSNNETQDFTRVIRLDSSTAAARFSADIFSFDTLGFTIDWTTAVVSGDKLMYLAVEESPPLRSAGFSSGGSLVTAEGSRGPGSQDGSWPIGPRPTRIPGQ